MSDLWVRLADGTWQERGTNFDPTTPDPPGPDFQSSLVLNENWDTLDTDLWYPEDASDYGSPQNRIQWYLADNAVVSTATSGGVGSSMKLLAKRESVAGHDFTAGMLGTRDVGIYYPRWGRYEARMRIPHGHGVWPAFWLRHRDGSNICEVDVMEYFIGQIPGKIACQVHRTDNSGSYDFNTITDGNKFQVYEAPVAEGSQGWTTVAVDILPWTATTYGAGTYGDPDSSSTNVLFRFSQNGTAYLNWMDTQSTNWSNRYDDRAFDICLQGSQIGGDYVGHPDDPVGYSRWKSGGSCIVGGSPPNACTVTVDGYSNREADFPNTFEVDHVRVWQYTGAPT